MPSQKHVHKYYKKRINKNYVIYACALPDCSHYLHEELIVGKKTICWVCEKQTVIYKDNNGVLAKPHCKSCTKRKKKDDDLFDLPPLSIPNVMP